MPCQGTWEADGEQSEEQSRNLTHTINLCFFELTEIGSKIRLHHPHAASYKIIITQRDYAVYVSFPEYCAGSTENTRPLINKKRFALTGVTRGFRLGCAPPLDGPSFPEWKKGCMCVKMNSPHRGSVDPANPRCDVVCPGF